MSKGVKIGLLLTGIIVLSVVDIAANTVSLIPVVGDILETTSETIIELLQIALVGLLAVVAGGSD